LSKQLSELSNKPALILRGQLTRLYVSSFYLEEENEFYLEEENEFYREFFI